MKRRIVPAGVCNPELLPCLPVLKTNDISRLIPGHLSLIMLSLTDFQIYNYEASYRSGRSLYLVVALFLYGFIIVVSLIGVTNGYSAC